MKQWLAIKLILGFYFIHMNKQSYTSICTFNCNCSTKKNQIYAQIRVPVLALSNNTGVHACITWTFKNMYHSIPQIPKVYCVSISCVCKSGTLFRVQTSSKQSFSSSAFQNRRTSQYRFRTN